MTKEGRGTFYMRIDLHTHSYFSDGECSLEEIILEAKNNNVSVLSITDHNILAETEHIKEYAKQNSIYFVEGIEISTLHRLPSFAMSLHVLGYGKVLDRNLLNKRLLKTVDGYNNRARKIIDKLNKRFPMLKLDFDLLKTKNHEVYVSRNTLARLLVEHLKNTISIKDALKQFVFIEEDDSWMMAPEESFQIIADAGGIPVLAHSGRELQKMGLVEYESMIAKFVQAGLLGLEVYYSKHTSEEITTIKNLAKRYNLYITGGSDWHGKTYTSDIQVGKDIPEEDIFPFLNAIQIEILTI